MSELNWFAWVMFRLTIGEEIYLSIPFLPSTFRTHRTCLHRYGRMRKTDV